MKEFVLISILVMVVVNLSIVAMDTYVKSLNTKDKMLYLSVTLILSLIPIINITYFCVLITEFIKDQVHHRL